MTLAQTLQVSQTFDFGLVVAALAFGLRHGIDWDHIAAITDITASQDSLAPRSLTFGRGRLPPQRRGGGPLDAENSIPWADPHPSSPPPGPHRPAGVKRHQDRVLQDCAEICQTAANFMVRLSDMHGRTCLVCAEVCERCAEGYEAFGDDEQMLRCAEACRRCAQNCREMAEMAT